MDIPAIMNLHDLAMTKTIRQKIDTQTRREKQNEQIDAQDANQPTTMGNKTPLEAQSRALANTVEHQEDPQAVKNRVERQVDVQAAKETVNGAEEKRQENIRFQETGTFIDIVT